eukprot:CAMPEP_0177665766 /NCGR_PEP_ID=MMETSP0447-20121125/21229_1 /TAXON_ID=0 /ORGANISM="Stygamoeba regulata, Strain BSH-02190019" /LENGTH=457 /DNA_ID=CAMNT_0019171881 /DNA_START=69 /DNA_END=1442 /DNA_ORIENTATION=+
MTNPSRHVGMNLLLLLVLSLHAAAVLSMDCELSSQLCMASCAPMKSSYDCSVRWCTCVQDTDCDQNASKCYKDCSMVPNIKFSCDGECSCGKEDVRHLNGTSKQDTILLSQLTTIVLNSASVLGDLEVGLESPPGILLSLSRQTATSAEARLKVLMGETAELDDSSSQCTLEFDSIQTKIFLPYAKHYALVFNVTTQWLPLNIGQINTILHMDATFVGPEIRPGETFSAFPNVNYPVMVDDPHRELIVEMDGGSPCALWAIPYPFPREQTSQCHVQPMSIKSQHDASFAYIRIPFPGRWFIQPACKLSLTAFFPYQSEILPLAVVPDHPDAPAISRQVVTMDRDWLDFRLDWPANAGNVRSVTVSLEFIDAEGRRYKIRMLARSGMLPEYTQYDRTTGWLEDDAASLILKRPAGNGPPPPTYLSVHRWYPGDPQQDPSHVGTRMFSEAVVALTLQVA